MSFQPQVTGLAGTAVALTAQPGDSGVLVQLITAGSAFVGGPTAATTDGLSGLIVAGFAAPLYIPPVTQMGAADVGGIESGLYGINASAAGGTILVATLLVGH